MSVRSRRLAVAGVIAATMIAVPAAALASVSGAPASRVALTPPWMRPSKQPGKRSGTQAGPAGLARAERVRAEPVSKHVPTCSKSRA